MKMTICLLESFVKVHLASCYLRACGTQCSLRAICNPHIAAETKRWRHNGHDNVPNHQPHGCLLNRLFRHRSKKTSKLRVTGLCARNSPGTGEFPLQMASYAENVSIWWRHHASGMSYWRRAIRCKWSNPEIYIVVSLWSSDANWWYWSTGLTLAEVID